MLLWGALLWGALLWGALLFVRPYMQIVSNNFGNTMTTNRETGDLADFSTPRESVHGK